MPTLPPPLLTVPQLQALRTEVTELVNETSITALTAQSRDAGAIRTAGYAWVSFEPFISGYEGDNEIGASDLDLSLRGLDDVCEVDDDEFTLLHPNTKYPLVTLDNQARLYLEAAESLGLDRVLDQVDINHLWIDAGFYLPLCSELPNITVVARISPKTLRQTIDEAA